MRDEAGGARRGKAEKGGEGVKRILGRIIGAPDYQTYLDHCRTAGHPPRMTEREFVAAFFESKGKGVRCC
jgi:uncharacterized short protein YbdD (DUF466 family)